MSNNDEIYERGIQDAAEDDLNPFYYQHYYHYRQGYDLARRRMYRKRPVRQPVTRKVWPALFVVVLLALIGAGLFIFTTPGTRENATAQLPPEADVVGVTAMPVEEEPPPSPLPEPVVDSEPHLQIGGTARIVNLNNAVLRGRSEPGITQPVLVRFTENSAVTILEGPAEADDYTWWRVANEMGTGWVAEGSLDGVIWLEPQ